MSGTFTGEGLSFRVGMKIVEMLRDGNYYGEQGTFAKHHALFREQAKALMERRP